MKRWLLAVLIVLGCAVRAQAQLCPTSVAGTSPTPTSCWPLQETTGTAIIDTVGVNTGAISGSYTLNKLGGIACSNSTGSGCSITTPVNYTSPQPFTLFVEFSGTSGGILQLGTASAINAIPYFVLYLDTHGKLTFGVNNFQTNQIIQSPLPYADGNEHDAVISVGPGGMKMYVDGSLVSSSGVQLASYANGYWFFGGVNTANWPLAPSLQYFNGTLTTVAWWNGTQLDDVQIRTITGGLPAPIANNYCTFSNQIASLNPSTALAFANKKLTFTSINQLQVPGIGSNLPIGPGTTQVCQTDAQGNIQAGCQIPQGAHVNLSVGNGPPIPLVIPASTSCDLTAIVASQTDPPEVVSAVAVAGPLFAGTTVTNPPPGTIGTSTITSPASFSQTQSATANIDINTNGNVQQVIMTGDVTVNLTNFQDGAEFYIDTTEDVAGGHNPTFVAPNGWTLSWPQNVSQPNISSAPANSHSVWRFIAIGGNQLVGNFPVIAGGFPLTATGDAQNYSIINLGGLQLQRLPAPSNIQVTATCSGTCATTYTYEVSCLNDVGEGSLSAAFTATNASALSSSNSNVVSWSTQLGCVSGYNVYGRISGALSLLKTEPQGTTSFTDDGSITAAAIYKFTFSGAASPAVAVWDVRQSQATAPIDLSATNAAVTLGNTNTATAPSITTSSNHDLQFAVYGYPFSSSRTFVPPGGFFNTVTRSPISGQNFGLWGGMKDIAAAGATGAVTATFTPSVKANLPYAAINLGVLPLNPSNAITFVASTSAAAAAPYTSVTVGDPAGTVNGDLEVACVSWKSGITLSPPLNFVQITPIITLGNGNVALQCFTNYPQGSAAVAVVNNTVGIITQFNADGSVNRESDVGMLSWSPDSANVPAGVSGHPLKTIVFPTPITITACRATWAALSCSGYPVWAIEDLTSSTVLCSSGTTSNTATDGFVSAPVVAVPANDVIGYIATTPGTSCTTGEVSMMIVGHQG